MATVNDLAVRYAREMGEIASDKEVQEQFEEWVREAYRDLIGRSFEWNFARGEELLTTSAGNAIYSLPNEVADVLSIIDNDTNRELAQRSESELARRGFDLEQQSQPRVWIDAGVDPTVGARLIRLWPVPQSERQYTVVTSENPLDLTATDVFPLPPLFQNATRFYVLNAYLWQAGEVQLAGTYKAEYEAQVRQLLGRFTNQPAVYRVLKQKTIGTRPAPPQPPPDFPAIF